MIWYARLHFIHPTQSHILLGIIHYFPLGGETFWRKERVLKICDVLYRGAKDFLTKFDEGKDGSKIARKGVTSYMNKSLCFF